MRLPGGGNWPSLIMEARMSEADGGRAGGHFRLGN